MDNNDKGILTLIIIAVVAIGAAVLISLFYFNPTIEPIPTSELPDGYKASYPVGGDEVVIIFTHHDSNILPVVEGEIEIKVGFRDNTTIIIEDNGCWTIEDTKEGADIWWWSNEIRPNEAITFPTGELVTFVGFNSSEDSDPLFIIE